MMFRETADQDRVLQAPPLWKRHRWALLGVATALLGISLLVPWMMKASGVRASVAASRVTLGTVTRGRFVRDFAADGRVVAAGSPMLYSPASGKVSLRVQAGDAVRRGQVLATIDSPDIVAKLEQERASLQGLSFDLQRARLEADRGAAEAGELHAQAEVDHRTAQRELERSRRAHERGAYSELQLLRTEDALEKARFRLEQARRVLAAQPEQARFDVHGREALVARQRSVVEELSRQVEALELRSPVDGQVGQLQVADGATVPRDAQLLTVVDLTRLEVELQIPESFARDLAPGMTAEIGGNGAKWLGTVGGVSPEVVEGQVVARVRFGDPKPAGLRQSQRMSVRVVMESRDDVLTVERGGFVEQGGGYAWRMVEDVAVRTPVRLGATSISRVEILEGLSAGDRVVVSGVEAFDNAERVILSN
jgi:HlyD family secretion protein